MHGRISRGADEILEKRFNLFPKGRQRPKLATKSFILFSSISSQNLLEVIELEVNVTECLRSLRASVSRNKEHPRSLYELEWNLTNIELYIYL